MLGKILAVCHKIQEILSQEIYNSPQCEEGGAPGANLLFIKTKWVKSESKDYSQNCFNHFIAKPIYTFGPKIKNIQKF